MLLPRYAAYPAFHEETGSLSYQALEEAIASFSLFLHASNVKEGDRVAFVAHPSLETVIAFFALLNVGASPCLLSTRWPNALLSKSLEKARIHFFLNPDLRTIQSLPFQHFADPRPFILLFTSGSTKEPKLACLTKEQFVASVEPALPLLSLEEGKSCWLLSVPLFHVSGLSILFRCLMSGASFSFVAFDGITHLSYVPTQLFRLLQQPASFPKLSCLLLGGAPIGESLLKEALSKNLPLRTTYGMTETASHVTLSSTLSLPVHAGKVLPGREVTLGRGGEILVRGPILFCGYDTPCGPKLSLEEGGWFATKDLGAWDSQGHLLVRGRKDLQFISGGENISPEEVEAALTSLAHVNLAFVLPKKDPEYGQRPIAFLSMSSPMPPKEALQELLLPLLPKFAIPVEFRPIPEELRSQFKINRSELTKYVF